MRDGRGTRGVRRNFSALCALALISASAEAEWPRHTIDNSYSGADGARPGAFFGAAARDFLVVWEQSGVASICLDPGEGFVCCPWTTLEVGEAPNAEDAVLTDLDGDGLPDVVACLEGTQRRVKAFFGRADGGFDQSVFPLPPFKWMAVTPADLDADGRTDLVVAARFIVQGEQAIVAWLRPPAQGMGDPRDAAAWTADVISDAGWPMALLLEDIDADGAEDVIVADRFGSSRGLRWLRNPGSTPRVPGEPWEAHFVGLEERRVKHAAIADLDGDGDADFVASFEGINNQPPGLVWLEGVAPGEWLERPIPLPAWAGVPKNIAIADFDLDGRPDIALSCDNAYESLAGVCVFYGRPEGEWLAANASGPGGCKFDLLTPMDLDGDGDLDLVTTEEGDNGDFPALGVVWYENPKESPRPTAYSIFAAEPAACELDGVEWWRELVGARQADGPTKARLTPP